MDFDYINAHILSKQQEILLRKIRKRAEIEVIESDLSSFTKKTLDILYERGLIAQKLKDDLEKARKDLKKIGRKKYIFFGDVYGLGDERSNAEKFIDSSDTFWPLNKVKRLLLRLVRGFGR